MKEPKAKKRKLEKNRLDIKPSSQNPVEQKVSRKKTAFVKTSVIQHSQSMRNEMDQGFVGSKKLYVTLWQDLLDNNLQIMLYFLLQSMVDN